MQRRLGGLGGFFGPIIFGYLLDGTGLWTSCWMFMWVISFICLFWMHNVVQSMDRTEYRKQVKATREMLASGT